MLKPLYTFPVTSKKGVIGIGLPLHPCSASRRIYAVSAALLSVPQVLVAWTEGRKAAVSRKGCTVDQLRSGCRPDWSRVGSFSNCTSWSPVMAKTKAAARPAQPPTPSRIIRITDACHHFDRPIGALRAIEAMVELYKADSEVDMPGLRRPDLASLLSIVTDNLESHRNAVLQVFVEERHVN